MADRKLQIATPNKKYAILKLGWIKIEIVAGNINSDPIILEI